MYCAKNLSRRTLIMEVVMKKEPLEKKKARN